jgi:DNA-binding FadR family transcriptional regulator
VKPNLTSRIANRIGIAIITGVYSADNPIPIEAQLCRDYQASRPVLREAVKMLTAKGLLAARPRRGTWVEPEQRWNLFDPDVLGWLLQRRFSRTLLIEFTQLRLAVEPGAATLAASVAGCEEKLAIGRALERMQAAERGADDPLDADIAFHVAVLRASRNRFFAQLTGFSATALRFSIRMTNRYRGVRLASVADHQKVADAISAGNARDAGEAMRRLIQEALDIISRRDAPSAARPSPPTRRVAQP